MAPIFAAFGHAQHVVVHELDQAPCAREAQQGFDAAGLHLLGVQLVGFDHHVDVVQRSGFGQVFVDVGKQR